MKRIALIVAVVSILITAYPALASNRPTREELLKDFKRYYQKGDVGKALYYIGRAIELYPDDPVLYKIRADVYIHQGLSTHAVPDLQRAVELGDNEPETWYKLGFSRLVEGNQKKAIEALNKAISLKPDYIAPRMLLGRIYYYKNKPDEAIKEFQKVLSIDPAYASAYEAIGTVYFYKKKDMKKAEEFFKKALSYASGKWSEDDIRPIKAILNLLEITALAKDFKVQSPEQLRSFFSMAADGSLSDFYEDRLQLFQDEKLYNTALAIKKALTEVEPAGVPEVSEYGRLISNYYDLKKETILEECNRFLKKRQEFLVYLKEKKNTLEKGISQAETMIKKGQFIEAIRKLNDVVSEANSHRMTALADRAEQLITLAKIRIKLQPLDSVKDIDTAKIFFRAIDYSDWLHLASKGEFQKDQFVVINGSFQQKVDDIVILKEGYIGYDLLFNTAYFDEKMNSAGLIFDRKRLFREGEFISCIGRFEDLMKFQTVAGNELEIPVFRTVWCEK